MAKVTLTDLASTNATSLVATINANNALIEAALEKTLSRDGTSPNTMEDTLDMNSERIINLPAPATATEPVRKDEFDTFTDALDSLLASNIEAVQALDDFTDIWLGAFSSDPAVDNDGGVLQEGALYFNTTTNRLKVYASGSWSTPLSGSVIDSTEIDAVSSGADVSLDLKTSSIVKGKLSSGVQASLDLADSASQPGHPHTLANVTDVTMTVANLNSLDDGVNSTLHFHNTDRDRSNHTGTQLAATISDFTEAAQDSVGAMVNTTLVYTDGTPLLERAAITGHITIAAGSNSAALGSFTAAQLDAAVSDANVSYTTHTHTLTSGATDVTITAANLNALDDGVNTALHFHDSDRSRANHTGTQLASTISDFNEAAQDAVGGMVDATLVYSDATPSLSRAALTGAVTASAGSNATSLGSFTISQLNTAVSDADLQVQDTLLDSISTLVDPNADRILFWDDSAGNFDWLTIGTNLTITGTTLNASGGGGGGGLSDADYGDITVSAAGTVMTIDNDVVTFAKMQNVAANAILARAAATPGDVSEVALSASNLLGRGSTGDVAAISLGTNLSMSGTTLNTTGLASTSTLNYFNANQYVVSSDSSATAGPILYLWRDSASPAASDDIGQLNFYGRNSVAAEKTYATLQGTIVDATAASEDAGLDVDIISAGTLDRRFRFEPENRYGYNNAGANQGVNVEEHWIKLAADYTLTSSVSEQKLFNTTTNGRLTLGTGTYFFECMLYLTTMSATSGNMAFDPIGGGTAVGASFLYHAVGIDSTTPLSSAAQGGSFTASQQTVASLVTAAVGTGLGTAIRGTFRITTAGTIIPSGTLATANAAVVKAGSYFRIWKAGEENVNSVGAWD